MPNCHQETKVRKNFLLLRFILCILHHVFTNTLPHSFGNVCEVVNELRDPDTASELSYNKNSPMLCTRMCAWVSRGDAHLAASFLLSQSAFLCSSNAATRSNGVVRLWRPSLTVTSRTAWRSSDISATGRCLLAKLRLRVLAGVSQRILGLWSQQIRQQAR